MIPEIILASASPRRADILKKYGISFRQFSSNAEETGSLYPESAAMNNAGIKALDISAKFPKGIVLGADTVIEFGDQIIGKPADVEDAVRILKTLSGKTHFVTTGVTLLYPPKHVEIVFAEVSTITFKRIDETVIRDYISKVNVLDKAGAYALQEFPELIIESVNGDPENVIGLPYRAIESLKYLLSLFS
jgi:septum formation protein